MHLVMVNGPCGSGKSTTSKMLFEAIPGSMPIQTDALRKTVPEQMFMKDESPDAVARMWRANEIGREIAARALGNGSTVIVDSIKYQRHWVQPWEQLGREFGANVLDVCLIAPKEVIEQRAAERGYKPGGRLNPQKVSKLYDRVASFYKGRRNALIINNEDLQPQEVVDLILERIV